MNQPSIIDTIDSSVIESTSVTKEQTDEINFLIHLGFHENEPYKYQSYFQPEENVYIITLIDNHKTIAIAFIKKHTVDTYDELPSEYFKIYNLSIHPNYRGYGLCGLLMKRILQTKIDELPLQKHYLTLNVFTSKHNPNVSAIKCYQKHKFKFIPTVIEMRSEGPYTEMMREPNFRKTKTTRSKQKKKQTKKKKKKKKQ